MRSLERIEALLGVEAEWLLGFDAPKIPRTRLHLPGPDWVDQIFGESDRPIPVLRNLQALFGAGRLANTGYLSILPVDQGVEHSAGSSFAPNPLYFDGANIVELALAGGCNAVASTLGVLGSVARRYAHKIPFIVKLNHNELLGYPNRYEQTWVGQVDQAVDMGAVAVGATVYFGSDDSRREWSEVADAFAAAHAAGLATVLWCYLRNPAFVTAENDYHTSADLTGQANHLGATLGADLLKQKQPTTNGGFRALQFGRTSDRMYAELMSAHPIDWTRYQVANGYMGRAGLINSGGASGENDLAQVVRTAVINKRAGGMGLITGRKAFQRPFKEGVALLEAVQDVYLCEGVTPA